MGCIGLCFVRVLSLRRSGLSVGALGASELRLVSEMTYNDPAHSLTVFSLMPVGFLTAVLTVVINDRILLPCYVFAMFILAIIKLKITYKS